MDFIDIELKPCHYCTNPTDATLTYEDGKIVCLDCHFDMFPEDWFGDDEDDYE